MNERFILKLIKYCLKGLILSTFLLLSNFIFLCAFLEHALIHFQGLPY